MLSDDGARLIKKRVEKSRPEVILSEAVILNEVKNLFVEKSTERPFAEFTLERSEGLRVTAEELRMTY